VNRDTCVKWLGLDAVYTDPEREILATLPIREQAYVHILKAFCGGTIEGLSSDGDSDCTAPLSADRSRLHGGLAASNGPPPVVYTDPEDIPFGDGAPTPRKRPLYALSWTWQGSMVYPTKRVATLCMSTWKKCYEARGWKVSNHAEGYFAAGPENQRHSIALHEYDRDTLERIR
jgi:hypothetical protein